MKHSTSILFASLLVFVVATGCNERIGDFTLISTKNVEVGGKYKKLNQRFVGTDSRSVLLGAPLGNPSLKTAVDECIAAGQGDLLTDAVLESKYWTIIIWGEMTISVTADVWVKATVADLHDSGVELYELQGADGGFELLSVSDGKRTVPVEYFLASRW